MFQTNNIAIADEKIVQVDQELKFLLPIKVGDVSTVMCTFTRFGSRSVQTSS